MTDAKWSAPSDAFEKLKNARLPHWENYLGFYSSWLNGYFREPWAMLLPMDEHGFHRGDGVFEAVRLQDNAYFDLNAHLLRLKKSGEAIGMELPKSVDEIAQICLQLAKLCASSSGILRLYVTRGPGSFSPSPREVVGQQIYAAITKLRLPEATLYSNGCRAMLSTVPAKEPFWSQIKSCNYLQNVLMKQECLAKGMDFAISVDPAGRLCEGSTENMLLISKDNEMIVPKFDYTLRGTTVSVVLRLAQALVEDGTLKSARLGDVTQADLLSAREAAFVGTTLGVLPLVYVDGKAIGSGQPGSVCRHLHQALMREMSSNPELRTAY